MVESYRLKIEYVPLDKLKPYERNARKHGDTDIDAIAASIKRFGFKDPIGVWGKDIIVEGHGRLLAAKKLGLAEVPIIRLDDLTDEERRMYALAHNKTAELSSWDENMVDSELEELDGIFDMDQMGFSEDEQNTQDEKPEVEFSEILGEENNYIVDDDMKGLYLWEGDESNHTIHKRLIKTCDLMAFFDKYSYVCEEMGYKYWGANCNQDAMSYRPVYIPFHTNQYIGGPLQVFLKGNECFYDERLPLKEDYDMTLQQCNRYRGCLRLNFLTYDVKQSEQTGGCASYRTMMREKEQFELLRKKWGENIVKEDKSNKGRSDKEHRFDYNPIIHVPIKGV